MIPLLDNRTILHYQDQIRIHNGRQTVGDHKEVRPLISVFMARLISISVRVSTEEVASSRIRMAGSQSMTLAMVRSWRCPAEIVSASLPRTVSYPLGSVRIKSRLWLPLQQQ